MMKYLFGLQGDNTEYMKDTTIEPIKLDAVVVIRPRKADKIKYDTDRVVITTLFECEDIFTYGVYPRIVEVYEKAYNNIYWVVQTEDPDKTVDQLNRSGIKNVYQGDAGLGAVLTQVVN